MSWHPYLLHLLSHVFPIKLIHHHLHCPCFQRTGIQAHQCEHRFGRQMIVPILVRPRCLIGSVLSVEESTTSMPSSGHTRKSLQSSEVNFEEASTLFQTSTMVEVSITSRVDNDVCLPNPCRGGCFSMQTARYGLPVDLVSMIDTERTGV
jgi:hypothetical protein